MSARYKLDKKDGTAILKVLAYAGISAIIATAIEILPQIDLPVSLAVLIPAINVLLVGIKKLLDK